MVPKYKFNMLAYGMTTVSYLWSVLLQSLKSFQHFNKKWGPIQSKEKNP